MVNYKKIGLKAGLEIHQQLDTKKKLFCSCSTQMVEMPLSEINRKQHPVASELGEIDIAAQYEFLRDRSFRYQVFPKEVCLVCLDEEPPHELNREALDIALQIALMFNCQIPNEIQIMRKTVTDGSTPMAFQRTAIVGMNGFLRYRGKKIEIKTVNIEEDAAAIVDESDGHVTYRLNRLGIPLVEISTGLLVGFTPEEIQDIAYHIGMICRSTNKVKRGIGTIRQDLNVSISVGARTEIKGIQELGLLSKVIEYEVQRQLTLNKIRDELRRKVRRITHASDATKILRDTRNRVLQSILAEKGNIYAVTLPNFSGFLKRELCPGKTLGRELADLAVAFGVKGIFHTDEDMVKNQTFEDFQKLRDLFSLKEKDAVILVGELKDKGKAANQIAERCNKLLQKIEGETRAANADGTTRYTRPLPGAARLYPETDIVPVSVAKESVEKIKKSLPEPLIKKLGRFKTKLKLSDQLAKQILSSDWLDLFEQIIKTKRVDASIVANTFTSTLKDLEKRERIDVENLTERHLLELFDYVARKRIVKEAIPEILKYLAAKPQETVHSTISQLGLKIISVEELKKIASTVVIPGMDFDKAVGLVMSKVRGRIGAQLVKKVVKKILKG